ncbi:hypothetical protein [Clostridioides difficile]|uniref:hypothetical protein n=1 Tax=Clostridioides difficile TaxID=1496 RepID=UPI001034085A|nr:hypothetical protein [Clostridioides difficile]
MLKNDGSKMEKIEIIKLILLGTLVFLLFVFTLAFTIISVIRLNIPQTPIGIAGCILGILAPIFFIIKLRKQKN